MSIQTEITRIQTAKEDLKTAINAKGGSLADETLDHYAQAVTALPEAGTDTSDATAPAEGILKGYTAYVNGEKIRGTHECDSLDTRDATATASDILYGETAYVNGEKITGTIRVQDDIVISLEPGQDVILQSGYYNDTLVEVKKLYIDGTDIRYGVSNDGLARSGLFTGDATATASDIIKGKTAGIKGEMVTGTLIPSSTFYKCTAVDSENMTWSGQKAVLSGESYSFEDTATEGLTFGEAFTPSVGKIYSEDLRVVVRSLYTSSDEGAILYAPFIDSLETETGQTLTLSGGTVTYTEVDGVPCISYSADEPTITGPLEIPEKFTICFWAKTDGYYGIRVDIGGSKRGTMTLQVKSDQIVMTEQSVSNFSSVSSTNNTALSCFVGTFESGSQQIWKDGVLLTSTSYVPSSSPPEDSVRIRLFNGSMTRLRIFDRILTANEIIALADELQPSA